MLPMDTINLTKIENSQLTKRRIRYIFPNHTNWKIFKLIHEYLIKQFFDTVRTEANIQQSATTHKKVSILINRFVNWLERFGEVSQDQYNFWASTSGQKAKSLYYRNPLLGAALVAPFVLLDAFLPASRKWFWNRQRFPIADAHFAMGFAFLFQATGVEEYYYKAVHFLNELQRTRCPGYKHHGWGYPFDWITNGGLNKRFTPLITTTPYVYEAFAAVYEIDGSEQWLDIMQSIAEHVATDYAEKEIKKNVRVCSYIPLDKLVDIKFHHVVNANSYRAFMLSEAANRFGNNKYGEIAEGNLNFVLNAQQLDGSWLYATDGSDPFIDHFHTCFVLKNLIKIERLTRLQRCTEAIQQGKEFYLAHLIDEAGLPRPFAKTQRIVLYRRELYDYAESINLAILQREKDNRFEKILDAQLSDLFSRWQKPDGSFRTRQLLLGWNNVPYHRWGQSQLFRSLSFLLLLQAKSKRIQTANCQLCVE